GPSGGAPADAWMEVREVVRDLIADPPEWTVVRSTEGMEPSIGVLCPALRHGLDGADLPSIVIPPPGEIRFRLGEFEGPLFLRLRAGVDISAVRALGKGHPEGVFGFEVRVDGRTVQEAEVPIHFSYSHAGSEWVDIGGPDGIEVRSDAEVVLRTFARSPGGEDVIPAKKIDVGFGGIRLERHRRVPRTRSSADSPNLLLVVMDTQRMDRISAYGYPRRTTPQVESLAEGGVVFENAYSTSSWTWPATASILTGLQPEEHGVRDSSSCFLSYQITTIAEVLQAAGVTTAAWSGNPLITASRGFDQGFEFFQADRGRFQKAGEFFGDVTEWLREHRGMRFFVYLQLIEPHQPYVPLPAGGDLLAPGLGESERKEAVRVIARAARAPLSGDFGADVSNGVASEEERERISQLYDACVWSGDRWVGELLRVLDELDLAGKTVVVFTSDHGEELFERGRVGHGKRLYEELVHVPLVIAGPGIPRGLRVPSVVSNRSVAPFLASLADASLGHPLDRDGLFDPEHSGRVALFSTQHGFWKENPRTLLIGMRKGSRVILAAPEVEVPDAENDATALGNMELFDLSSDPEQRRN
ncbi:MAG: hypothetical protein D6812_08415, partial [Deltaproteobacteria bacterium]